jgi:hypothetical protein
LDYLKNKDKFTNETQMNMVKAITSLINGMNMIFLNDQGKEIVVPK